MVGIGVIGNLLGYPIRDPIPGAIVGCMVARMRWSFDWDAVYELLDRAIDGGDAAAI